MRVLSSIVLATALLCTVVGCRKAELPDFVTANEKTAMETNPCWPLEGKGGVGVIYDPLYVYTSTKRNGLTWDSGKNAKVCMGRNARKSEVVVFYDDKIWPPQSLPHGFDKSKSVVVSFEEKKICFYDYVHREGGYYDRHPPKDWDAN
jgi:hypothetical protein